MKIQMLTYNMLSTFKCAILHNLLTDDAVSENMEG